MPSMFSATAAPARPRPLRVCHLVYSFYERDSRVQRYVYALARQGHSVEVIGLRRAGDVEKTIDNVSVTRIQRRTVSEMRPLTYLLKLVAFLVRSTLLMAWRHIRRPYDVIHVHNVPDFLVLAAVVPRLLGARVILDIHDLMPELFMNKFHVAGDSLVVRSLLVTERICCRAVDHVIIANDLWHEKVVARSVDPARCTTSLNYPDLRLFRPQHDRQRRNGKFIMLYPGSLNHHQGVDIAIRALARAKDSMPGAELHIYGEGPERRHLTELVTHSGVEDRVRIFEPLPLIEIARVMAAADLGVVPKRTEGFGGEAFSTKTLEFMACGVPVVVSRTKVDAYYFNSGLVRFFTPESDISLAEAMLEMYENRGDRGRVERARKHAVRYSWQERAPDYLQLVERLVRAPAACSASAV